VTGERDAGPLLADLAACAGSVHRVQESQALLGYQLCGTAQLRLSPMEAGG
jgi:hypothetical protein